MPYQKLRNFAQLIRDHLNLGLDRGSHLPNYPVFPGHRSAQNKRKERLQHPWHHLQSSLRGGEKKPTSITTSVQGGMWGDARMAARRLAWERLARSLLSCISSSHRSNSVGPNRSRGSISRTTR